MTDRLALALGLAVAVCACSQPPPPPVATACPEPTRVSGDAAFDTQNKADWSKELQERGNASCDEATKAYITRMEERRGEMILEKASGFAIYGRVTDAETGEPVAQVCVTPGHPGAICWGRTDADGWYLLDIGIIGGQPGFFEIFFSQAGYPTQKATSRMISGRPRIDYQMAKQAP